MRFLSLDSIDSVPKPGRVDEGRRPVGPETEVSNLQKLHVEFKTDRQNSEIEEAFLVDSIRTVSPTVEKTLDGSGACPDT